jgi:hypothetical protein
MSAQKAAGIAAAINQRLQSSRIETVDPALWTVATAGGGRR